MEDIAEFDNRESVTHATFQVLEKEGVNLSASSPCTSRRNPSPQCLDENSVFGVPLDSTWRCSVAQCGSCSVPVPKFLADAINFLGDYLTLEGIFRKAGSLTRLKEIKVYIQAGGSLADHHKPHDVACLLKLFLRELPDPLLTNRLSPAFASTRTFPYKKKVNCVLLLCLLLPKAHLNCLKVLCHFLHKVSTHSDHNLMDTVNLALVMAPNLLSMTTATTMVTAASHSTSSGHETPLEASTSVIEILIEYCSQIGLVPEAVASVARQLVDDYGADYRWRDLGNTPDGLVTPDGSTGDELDSDGDVAMGTTGHTHKKSTKKSRTRMFVHNLGNKLRSRYGNKSSDNKTPTSSPVTKAVSEHVPRMFSHLDSGGTPSSPLTTIKRKADHDPHLMSASKRQAILQQSVGTSKSGSGRLFRTPLTVKATKKSILRRCRHTDYGKMRKNTYLVLQPSYSAESLADYNDDGSNIISTSSTTSAANNCPTATYSDAEVARLCGHPMIPHSISDNDGFPLVEFTVQTSHKENRPSKTTTHDKRQHCHGDVALSSSVEKTGVPAVDKSVTMRRPFKKAGSVPCQPFKTSISADDVKYFSTTPDINFIKFGNNHHGNLSPYRFEAKASSYRSCPRSVSAHDELKSAYQFGSLCNLVTTNPCSSSSSIFQPTNHQDDVKSSTYNSSIKKSASHPLIRSITGKVNPIAENLHRSSIKSFKENSTSPPNVTGNPDRLLNDNVSPKNSLLLGACFKFSQPSVQSGVATRLLVDTPQYYSDVEKDPESSEIYCTDEVVVSHLASKDVCKQLFAAAEDEPSPVCQEGDEIIDTKSSEVSEDVQNTVNTDANSKITCSDLLAEISNDLAEKHRYSPNYVTPLSTAQSVSNNEIMDYTGSPRHCVNAETSESLTTTKCLPSWQDDYQRCQKELYGFNPRYSPDPWGVRRRSQSTTSTCPVDTTDCPKIDFTDGETNNTVIASDKAPTVSHAKPSSTASKSTVGEEAKSGATTYGRYPWVTSRRPSTAARLPESSISDDLAKSLHVDSKYVANESTSAFTRPRLSVPVNSKTTTMPKFYKEMVPLSRRPLKKTDNVQTKIKQFENIALQKEKDVSCCTDCGIAGKVRDLENSPRRRQHYRVKRAETWSFRSPVARDTPAIHGETSRLHTRTHYTFHSPKKVKDDLSHIRKLNRDQLVSSTTDNRVGHDRKDETAVVVPTSRKRMSPVGHTNGRKIARSPLSSLQHHQNNAEDVIKPDSTTTTEAGTAKSAMSLLTTGKENDTKEHGLTTKTKNNPEHGAMLNRRGLLNKEETPSVYRINQFPTTQTIVLREWIV